MPHKFTCHEVYHFHWNACSPGSITMLRPRYNRFVKRSSISWLILVRITISFQLYSSLFQPSIINLRAYLISFQKVVIITQAFGHGTIATFTFQNIYYTRKSGRYTPFFLAPVEGWGPFGPPDMGPLVPYCGVLTFIILSVIWWDHFLIA